ncbi:MAG: diguanylate cyclase [Spirochaetota bacterium]
MPSSTFSIITAIFSEEKTKTLVVENGFSILDYAGGRVLLSERLAALGLKPQALLSREEAPWLHEEDRQGYLEQLSNVLRGHSERVQGQYRFLRSQGEPLWLSVSIRPLEWDAAGAPSLVIIHDEDISSLHAAQEEIRERLIEIDSLKDLLFAINKSLDFDDTIHRIIAHLHKVIPFDRASVQSYDGTDLTVIGSYGYPPETVKSLKFPVKGVDNPSAQAISSRRPMICNDVIGCFNGFIQVDQDNPVRSWLGIPLVYEGRSIGLFSLDSGVAGFYNDRHARIASNVAEHISIAVEHARQHSLVKEEARTDGLTGVANRYGLETVGQEIFLKALRNDSSLGVLMADIDFFKDVNDTKGHNFGDKVLVAIAQAITHSLRTKDYLVRFGGEEFVILLPETSTREALVVAERLREMIPRTDVDGKETCPTISIGVFSGIPAPHNSLHEFIHYADLALYDAKAAGRNRCRVWRPKA